MGNFIQDALGKMRPVRIRTKPTERGFICEDEKGQHYFVEKYDLVVYKARRVGETNAESHN